MEGNENEGNKIACEDKSKRLQKTTVKTEKKRAGDCIKKEIETGKRKAESVEDGEKKVKKAKTNTQYKIMKKGEATQLNPARQGESNEDSSC